MSAGLATYTVILARFSTAKLPFWRMSGTAHGSLARRHFFFCDKISSLPSRLETNNNFFLLTHSASATRQGEPSGPK